MKKVAIYGQSYSISAEKEITDFIRGFKRKQHCWIYRKSIL